MMLAIFYVSGTSPGPGGIPDFGHWDFPVKKTAHLCEYVLLAISMLRGVRGGARPQLKDFLWALALTVLYAVTDEFHQTFVPGREGRVTDVLIDTLGASLGLTLRGLRD